MEQTKNPFNPELLFFLFLIIIVLPYGISMLVFTTKLDFGTNTGTLGDTIGGLTAPFIGFLSSILVFYAFKEQVKANEIQVKANSDTNRKAEEDNVRRNIDSVFEKISTYFESFEYYTKTGQGGINQFTKTIYSTVNTFSLISQSKFNLAMTSYDSPEAAIANEERKLRSLVVCIRHASIIIQLCLSHVNYLNRAAERYKSSEISDYIDIARKEISLFYLNRLDQYIDAFAKHFPNMHGRYRTGLLDQYLLSLLELDSLIDKQTIRFSV